MNNEELKRFGTLASMADAVLVNRKTKKIEVVHEPSEYKAGYKYFSSNNNGGIHVAGIQFELMESVEDQYERQD